MGILDARRVARDWLVKQEGITNEQIIVYGFSLGGSVAVDIAAKDYLDIELQVCTMGSACG